MNLADNDLMQSEIQAPPATPDISADRASGWMDWAVVAAVLVVAVWYLYRTLWAKRGGCAGCAKCKGEGQCSVQRVAAPPHRGVEIKTKRGNR